MIIAIDGPAASGKGTIARHLGAHFGLPHLDTGLLYRAVAHQALMARADFTDIDAIRQIAIGLALDALDGGVLRSAVVGTAASQVAAMAPVREALLTAQRAFARQDGGAVLDGRDIATVICPDADVKLYVDASAQVRATRRHNELQQRGETVSYEAVLDDILVRDHRDATRPIAPLRRSCDALLLDTTNLGIEAAIAAAQDLVSGAARRCHTELSDEVRQS